MIVVYEIFVIFIKAHFYCLKDVENGSNFNDVDKRNHIIEEVQSEGTTSVKDGGMNQL